MSKSVRIMALAETHDLADRIAHAIKPIQNPTGRLSDNPPEPTTALDTLHCMHDGLRAISQAHDVREPYAIVFVDGRLSAKDGALEVADLSRASPLTTIALWLAEPATSGNSTPTINRLSERLLVCHGDLRERELQQLILDHADTTPQQDKAAPHTNGVQDIALETVLEALPHPFYIVDTETHEILIANEAAIRGKPFAAGITCHKLTHRQDTPCRGDDDPCPMEMVRRNRGPSVVEHTHYLPDGGTGIFEVHGYPILDDSGELVQMIEYSLDITDRKRMEVEIEQRERLLRDLIENAPDGILLMGKGGRIDKVNKQFTGLFGYEQSELLGRGIEMLLPERFRETHKSHMRKAFETPFTQPVNLSRGIYGQRKDGSEFPVDISVNPVETEQGTAYLAFVRDITERKQHEAALIEAKQEAEASNKTKSEFLANMSHEIRTPMNGIIGMNTLLLETDLTEDQREFGTIVQSSAESLLGLINDILDFSKIEADRLDLESVDFNLADVIESVADTVAQTAFTKGVEFLVDIDENAPTCVRGDPARLRQILLNLSTNAVKFTEEGEIMIRVELLESEEPTTRMRFAVRDSGIGIPADKQAAVFERFSQADGSTTRKFGGTGLGLTISKKLSEMMGGELSLESEAGIGSTFWFTARFEQARRNVTPDRHVTGDTSALADRRVLVVDDNATNCLILVRLLETACKCVDTAFDGPHGLQLMTDARTAGRPYDIILLDMMMPGMDGIEVARTARDMGLSKNALTLILSSADRTLPTDELSELGIRRSLMKPLKLQQVVQALCSELSSGAGEAKGPVAPAAPPARRKLPPLKVLVAEDNLVNQKLAKRMLQNAGLDPQVVCNGREAVDASESNEFDVILMDMQMPEMDGLKATRCIREREQSTGMHISIIALTANAMEGDRERCLEAGMDGYVSKPIRADDLFDALEKHAPKHPGAGLTA